MLSPSCPRCYYTNPKHLGDARHNGIRMSFKEAGPCASQWRDEAADRQSVPGDPEVTTTAHLRGVYLGAAAAKSRGPDGRRRAPPSSQASGSVYSGPRSSQRVFPLGMDRDVVLRLSIRAQATPAKRGSATNGLCFRRCAERMSAREKCLRVDAYVKSVSSKEDEREPKKN